MERLTQATEPGAISLATRTPRAGNVSAARFRARVPSNAARRPARTHAVSLLDRRSRPVRAPRVVSARSAACARRRRRHYRVFRRAAGGRHRRDGAARGTQRRRQREPDVLGQPRRLRRARALPTSKFAATSGGVARRRRRARVRRIPPAAVLRQSDRAESDRRRARRRGARSRSSRSRAATTS